MLKFKCGPSFFQDEIFFWLDIFVDDLAYTGQVRAGEKKRDKFINKIDCYQVILGHR